MAKDLSNGISREWDFLRKNFIEAYQDFGQESREQELLPASILHRLQELTKTNTFDRRTIKKA